MRSDDTPDLLHVQNETRKGWEQGTSDQQDFDRSIGVKRVYFQLAETPLLISKIIVFLFHRNLISTREIQFAGKINKIDKLTITKQTEQDNFSARSPTSTDSHNIKIPPSQSRKFQYLRHKENNRKNCLVVYLLNYESTDEIHVTIYSDKGDSNLFVTKEGNKRRTIQNVRVDGSGNTKKSPKMYFSF